MTTQSFELTRADAVRRNKLLSYEDKQKIWDLCVMDWSNGHPPMSYVPFPEAEKIHKSKARCVVIAAGNRFSKSLIVSMEALCDLTVPGAHIWVIAPLFSVADNEWAYIEQALTKTDVWYKLIKPRLEAQILRAGIKKRPEQLLHVKKNTPKKITIDWPLEPASIIEQKSFAKPQDWASLEGAKLTMVIYSEGSRVPSQVHERHIKNRLADRAGRIFYPATPKGKDEVLYPAYLKGMSSELVVDINYTSKDVTVSYKDIEKSPYHVDNSLTYMESYETFQYPGYVNPYYNMANYEADKRLLFDNKLQEHIFRERNFGTFESFSGTFFNSLDWGIVLKNSNEFSIPEDATHFRAIDPGRATRACCLWVAILKEDIYGVEQWVVYDELYRSGLWATELAKVVKEQTRYPISFTSADRVTTRHTDHAEKCVEMQLRDAGISPICVPSAMPHKTIDRLNRLKPLFERGQITILEDKCPNLVREMQALEYEAAKYVNGKSSTEEVLAKSDMHAIDALTYLYYCRPSWKLKPQSEPIKPKEPEKVQPGSYLWRIAQKSRRESMGALIGTY